MVEEPTKLFAITPPKYMSLTCLTQDTLFILQESFQLSCYVPYLTPYLPTNRQTNIQEIFKALDNPGFFTRIRELANGFETAINISLLKAGLYLLSLKAVTIDLLSKVYQNYILFDTQNNRNGIPLEPCEILRTLVNINRFLPIKLINIWIEYNKSICKSEEKLQPHEYLFLVANSCDRLKLAKTSIKTQFCLDKNNIGVFELDASIEQHPNMDLRLESAFYSSSAIKFDFDKSVLDPPAEPAKIAPRRVKHYTETETVRKFKELLKDPELIFQVKATISNSRMLLHKTQNNNSKFSYMRYRKRNGAMGSLENSKVCLSKTMIRNNSNKTELAKAGNNSVVDIFDMKSRSRPVSASTTKYRGNSRPQTGKRPKTGGSLASTVVIHREELSYVKSFRETIMESYVKKQ